MQESHPQVASMQPQRFTNQIAVGPIAQGRRKSFERVFDTLCDYSGVQIQGKVSKFGRDKFVVIFDRDDYMALFKHEAHFDHVHSQSSQATKAHDDMLLSKAAPDPSRFN